MITKDKKKQIVKDLVDRLNKQKAVVFFDYTGLQVNDFQALRAKLRETGIECHVVKKSLIDLAINQAGLKASKVRNMPGQIAVVFGYEDEVMPAKLLNDYAKTNKSVKIMAGIVQGDFMEQEAIITLAKLPTKQELLGKVIGSISAPLYGLHNALKGNLNKLVYVLKGLKPEA